MTTTYYATMMHGVRGGEGSYTFDADDDLFERTPVRIMRTFMEAVKEQNHIDYVDYEINAAIKNPEAQTVMVLGTLNFSADYHPPFMCMISPKS